MPEGVEFPFPSLLFHEGRTYGQPEVVRISLPQVATGLRLRLPGSFRRRGFQPDLLMPQEALFARGAHSMQAVMHRALLRRGRSGRYHSLLQEMLTAGNQCRVRQKGGKRIMAIFHYTVKIVGRSKGKSIISASAYLNGDVMKNEETGRISYYTSKREVVYTSLMMCENAPQEWQNVPAENIKRFQKSVRYKRADNKEVVLEKFKLTFQKQCLWNEVLKIEKSSDAQLGRSFEFSLPKEWNRQEQIEYTTDYIQKNFVDKGMCADWSIHDKGDGNPHVHLLVTMRPFNPDREKNQTEMDRLTNYRRHLQNKIRRASPAEKETLREEKNGVTERITELRKRLKYADGIEKRSAHIDDCLNQIHDTVENQRSNQNGRTDRKREDALR